MSDEPTPNTPMGWIDTIKSPRVLFLLLATTILQGFGWNVLSQATGGIIAAPKTQYETQVECIARVLGNEEIKDDSLRGSLESCIPSDKDK
jgi:hypothetical protein